MALSQDIALIQARAHSAALSPHALSGPLSYENNKYDYPHARISINALNVTIGLGSTNLAVAINAWRDEMAGH